MVRLVIVFLQNILKQKVLDFEDISAAIKQFCMEHNTSKEAQDMLKKVIAEQNFQKDGKPTQEGTKKADEKSQK